MTSRKAHESLITSHSHVIGKIESSIRSLTWFLPWFRFRDADLASETLTALLNLTSLYHDVLIRKRSENGRHRHLSQILESDHSRYTTAWCASNTTYKYAAHALEIMRHLQLVVEMLLSRKKNSHAVWKGIVIIEMLKVAIRLSLIRATGRPLVSPPLPERAVTLATPADSKSSTSRTDAIAQKAPQTPDHLKNNHSLFQSPSTSTPNPLLVPTASNALSSVDDFLLSKALKPSALCPPTRLIAHLATPSEWVVEIIYILRPLLYALSIIPSSRQRRISFRPIIVSLLVEALLLFLRRPASHSLTLERREYARRDRELLWYLFRGAVWQQFSKPKLMALIASTEHLPIFGIFSALIRDWMPLIDKYHYYTSS